MLSVIGFLVVLAPLVIVHEFGHFFFAKLFNVKAEAFSVGFGPVVFAKKIGETDFRFSAFPLGGYVKLLGEDPSRDLTPDELKRALHMQSAWKRFFVFFGGPLFNFLWAVLVFVVMMAIGEPQVAPVIGRVTPGSPASVANLRAGDKITEVNHEPIRKFEELVQIVSEHPNSSIDLKVLREGQVFDTKVTTNSEQGYSIYGEEKQVGAIDGMYANPRNTKIGVDNPKSAAALAGIKTGDEIFAIQGRPVHTWEEVDAIEPTVHGKFDLAWKDEHGKTTTTQFVLKKNQKFSDLGINSIELFVEKPIADSPAAVAGVKSGDEVVSVDGRKALSFLDLRLMIQKAGETAGSLELGVIRSGVFQKYTIAPNATTERDPTLKKKIQYTVGVMPYQSLAEPITFVERTLNPITLVERGFQRMGELTYRNFVSIGKMFLGEVSVKGLGGPILIGKLAGDSLSRGLLDFLHMMAVLSVGLGVLNVLPVPVLDGGHILFLVIEVVRGKALSMKQLEMAQRFGLAMIMLLMIIAMRNDLSRLPIFN